MNRNALSIIIPTYNRENQLTTQLDLIFSSRIDLVSEIVVLDNNSSYEIEELINSYNSSKLRLIRQPFNIKVHNNLASVFTVVDTEWFWLLSDDDEIEISAIENIWNEIHLAPKNTALIKFSRSNFSQEEYIAKSLTTFIDYYYEERLVRRGDLVFISTNVYNAVNLEKYLPYAFEYAYTYIPHLIPVFKGLESGNLAVKFSSKEIVRFIPPREGWYSFGTVGKGLSTLSHIPLSISENYRKKFLDITMSITYKSLIIGFLKNEKIDNLNDFKIIYNNIYRYYIPFKSKVIVKMFFFIMSVKPLKIMFIRFLQLIKKIK